MMTLVDSRVMRAAVAGVAAMLCGCGSEDPGVGTAPEYIPGPPQYDLTGTYPVRGAIGVSLTPAIRAQFWSATDPAVLTNVGISLREDHYAGPLVPGAMSFESRAATFTPWVPLKPRQNYYVTVTSHPSAAAGARVPLGSYSWTFNTRAAGQP